MYPFYVQNQRVFSFSYKPPKGMVKDDATGKWYEVRRTELGRGRKVYGVQISKPRGIEQKHHS